MKSDTTGTVKRLRFLVVVLLLSNVALGVVSFYMLRSMDEAYSRLIDRSLPTLNHLRGMATEGASITRSLTFAQTAPAGERREGYGLKAEKSLQLCARHVQDAMVDLQAQLTEGARQDLINAWRDYEDRAGKAIATFRQPEVVPASELTGMLRELRMAQEEFLARVSLVSESIAQTNLRQSDMVSDTVQQHRKIVLGLGGWPIAALGVIASIVAVVLLTMVILAYRLGQVDEP